MIDGYSVQEAASVLGVPEGRVWELLARGVLSGTPEGDSMRVYLKADAAPIATTHRDEPPKTNGNASHANGGEASAFRELLTEFRNLTERYGQALLALGEARGEVAGLRSRVELLEARLDLRLPSSPDAGSVPWQSQPVAPVALDTPPVAAAANEPPPVARPPEPRPSGGARGSARSRKARSTRSAVDGFAQALARAQDPTTAEVSDELLADASVSLQVDEVPAPPAEQPIEEAPGLEATAAAAEPTVAEPEIVAAEPEIVAAEPETIAPEPEIVAAEPETIAAEPGPTVAEPAASEFEPQAEPEVAAVEPEPVPIVVESDLAAAAELEPEPVAEPDPAAAALQAAFDEPETTPEESAAPATEAQGASEARTTAASELEAAPPTYSANVVEPDWFADGDFAWLDAAELEASSPSVESAIEATPAEAPSAGPAPAEMPSAEPTPAEAAAAEPEPEPPGEAASESISASEIDAAPWAEPEVVDESDRLSMPDLPPMPDLPAAVDLPATPEAPLQASPEFQGEPEVAESVVELPEPVQPFEATQAIEPAEIERADAEAVEPVQPATPDESIQARGLDAGPSEEQVMWLGAESRAAAELETASSGWRAEPQPAPTITAQPPVAVAEPPLLRMTEEELARLARDEGWDEAEVAAIRAMIVPPPAPRVRLPGAAELDEAMAALQAVPVDGGEEASSSREWAKPPGETRSPRYDDWAFEVDSAPQRRIVDPLPPRSQPPDPGWLRRRQGPAATAYRRLRRLFPG